MAFHWHRVGALLVSAPRKSFSHTALRNGMEGSFLPLEMELGFSCVSCVLIDGCGVQYEQQQWGQQYAQQPLQQPQYPQPDLGAYYQQQQMQQMPQQVLNPSQPPMQPYPPQASLPLGISVQLPSYIASSQSCLLPGQSQQFHWFSAGPVPNALVRPDHVSCLQWRCSLWCPWDPDALWPSWAR